MSYQAIPVWDTFKEIIKPSFHNTIAYVKELPGLFGLHVFLAQLGMVYFLFADPVQVFAQQSADTAGSVIALLGSLTSIFLTMPILLIAIHRGLILKERPEQGFHGISWNSRTLHVLLSMLKVMGFFFGTMILVTTAAGLISALVSYLIGAFESELAPAIMGFVITASVMAATAFLSVRLSLCLPAAALDTEKVLRFSWDKTKDYFWPLLWIWSLVVLVLFIVNVATFMLGFMGGFLISNNALLGIIVILITAASSVYTLILTTSMISTFYKKIVRQKSTAKPAVKKAAKPKAAVKKPATKKTATAKKAKPATKKKAAPKAKAPKKT